MKSNGLPLTASWLVAAAALGISLAYVKPWGVEEDTRLALALGLAWSGPYLVLMALAWQGRADVIHAWLNVVGGVAIAAVSLIQVHQVFAAAAANPLAKIRALVVPCVGVAMLMGLHGALRLIRHSRSSRKTGPEPASMMRGG